MENRRTEARIAELVRWTLRQPSFHDISRICHRNVAGKVGFAPEASDALPRRVVQIGILRYIDFVVPGHEVMPYDLPEDQQHGKHKDSIEPRRFTVGEGHG